MTDPSSLLSSEYESGRVIIRLTGEIDLWSVESLEANIERAVKDVADVVIDLSAVDFIDSGGLRLLERASTAAAERDASFAVVAPSSSVARNVLDMTQMSAALAVRDAL